MPVQGRGRFGALGVVVCLAAAGCNCDDSKVVTWEPENDLSVSVRRAVSCTGEDLELSPLVYGGKDPYTFVWEPADGLSDPTARNPIAKGDRTREYQLTVTDKQGLVAVVPVLVERRPSAKVNLQFKAGAKQVCAGVDVQLDASGSVAGNGKPVESYTWDLGDGKPPVALAVPTLPAFTPKDGQHVTLTVTDDAGCTATVEETITVRALPTARVAFLEGRSAMCAGERVTLDGAGSRDADGNEVAAFAWDLDGDAATVESTSALSGTYAPSGTPARLVVRDTFGCEASVTQDFDVGALPVPEIAFAEGAAAVCSGATVRLDASGSKDAQGSLPKLAWDLDGVAATIESTEPAPPAFPLAAARSVTLTATDARGCRASRTEALVAHALPTARITFAKGTATSCAESELLLSAETSKDAAGAPLARYLWDLDGDGVPEGSGAISPALYAKGPQVASLVVVDANGCEARATQAISPRALPTPVVAFTRGDADVCEGELVGLDASASRDADGLPVASYAWDLDADGTVDSAAPRTVDFAPGAASPRLTLTDAGGCARTVTQQIAVGEAPVARIRFEQGGPELCAGGSIVVDAAGSTAPAGETITRYAWDFDGDVQTDESHSSQPAPFAPPESTDLRLTVTASNGCRGETMTRVTVRSAPRPVIDFTQGSANVCTGGTVALTGDGSSDMDGNRVVRFEWDIDSDGDVDATSVGVPPFVPRAQSVRLSVWDAQGCLGTATRAIAPRPPPTARIAFSQGSPDVCDGELVALDGAGSRDADGQPVASYEWDLDGDPLTIESSAADTGPVPPTGPATLRVTDAQGCVGTATQRITDAPGPTPVVRFLRGGAEICTGGEVALDGSASVDFRGQPVARYAWDLDGTASTIESVLPQPPALTPAGARTVALRVWDSRGCSADVTQSIAVRAPPTARITFASGAAGMCPGANVSLSGSSSTDARGQSVVRYAWDLDGNPSSTEWSSAMTPPFAPKATTTTTLTVTDALGCVGTSSQVLSVWPVPVANAGADAAICAGSPVRLGASPAADTTYAWSPAAGLDNASAAEPNASPASNTTYTLTAKNAFGCRATDSVQVAVRPVPVADAGPDREVSPGASVQLTGAASGGTPAYSYAWTPASGLTSATIAQPRASPSANTTYTLQVTDANGCRDTDDALVRMVPPLAVNVGRDQTFCTTGIAVPLAAATSGGAGPLTYRWTASPACPGCIASPSSANTTVTPTVTTTFTATVTDSNGVTATDSVVLSVRENLAVDAGADRRLQLGESTRLGAPAQPGVTYRWTCNRPVCGLSDPNVADPIATPVGSTVYTVTINDGITCEGTDTVLVATQARTLAAMPSEGFNPWPRDAPLWVVFDTDIDPASLAGNVYLLDPMDGAHIYIRLQYDAANRMLVVYPLDTCGAGCTGTKPYKNNNEFLLVLEGGAGGVMTSGPLPEPLYNDLALQFVASSMGDGTAPAIVHRRPAVNASNVTRDSQVVVKFAEHVDPRTVHAGTIWLEGVAATVDYDIRTKQVYVRPASPLASNRTYTVRVAGVVDARSSPSRINSLTTSWTFTTGAGFDTTAPRVVSFGPANGVVTHDVGAPVSVTFSEPIDFWTAGLLRLVDEATGYPILTDVLYDDQTLTATLSPKSFLSPSRAYRFEVSEVYDWGGNAVPALAAARFSTGAARLFEKFEGGTAGWAFDTPWGLDFQAAYVDDYGLSDSPGLGYAANASTSARTPAIDTTGLSQVNLSYYARQTLGLTDTVHVEYSYDGTTWTGAASRSGCSGWRRTNLTLPTNGRPSMYVRFRLAADANVSLDGWFLDEVVVR